MASSIDPRSLSQKVIRGHTLTAVLQYPTELGAVPVYALPYLSLISVLTHPMSVDGHFRSLYA